MREEIQAKTQEVDRETRRKAKLEKDLKAAQAECEARAQDIKAKQNQLQKAEEEYKRCEQQLRETRVRDCAITQCIYELSKWELYIYIYSFWNGIALRTTSTNLSLPR